MSCSVLQLIHCNTLQHNATHCNTLSHTATHCNTLQHTAGAPVPPPWAGLPPPLKGMAGGRGQEWGQKGWSGGGDGSGRLSTGVRVCVCVRVSVCDFYVCVRVCVRVCVCVYVSVSYSIPVAQEDVFYVFEATCFFQQRTWLYSHYSTVLVTHVLRNMIPLYTSQDSSGCALCYPDSHSGHHMPPHRMDGESQGAETIIGFPHLKGRG